jgi:hypothetical protein
MDFAIETSVPRVIYRNTEKRAYFILVIQPWTAVAYPAANNAPSDPKETVQRIYDEAS